MKRIKILSKIYSKCVCVVPRSFRFSVKKKHTHTHTQRERLKDQKCTEKNKINTNIFMKRLSTTNSWMNEWKKKCFSIRLTNYITTIWNGMKEKTEFIHAFKLNSKLSSSSSSWWQWNMNFYIYRIHLDLLLFIVTE